MQCVLNISFIEVASTAIKREVIAAVKGSKKRGAVNDQDSNHNWLLYGYIKCGKINSLEGYIIAKINNQEANWGVRY